MVTNALLNLYLSYGRKTLTKMYGEAGAAALFGDSSPYQSPPISRIDALLQSPISSAEAADLGLGPTVTFAADVPADARQRATQYIQGMMRAARAIRFDSPIPLLGVYSMWDYIKAHVRTIRVVPAAAAWTSDYSDGSITVDLPSILAPRVVWSDPANGGAGVRQVVVLVHEARHLADPEHAHLCSSDGTVCPSSQDARAGTCPSPMRDFTRDPSLGWGGAWAAHYWTLRWLAEHSGDWLTPENRAWAADAASTGRAGWFCDRR